MKPPLRQRKKRQPCRISNKEFVTISANKEAVRSYFEQFVNCGDMAAAHTIFAPEVRFDYPLGGLSGIEAVKQYIHAFRAGFPDVRFTIKDLFGEDNRVAVRWSMVGTQSGEFGGKPPTGKQVTLPGNTIFRVENGMIHEMWITFDSALLI